ncbi:PREDICTED: replication protein A 32 kDa subunit [Nicrophorus vespilloides]|uniref:Replication protein A 32 kDa subunit n=1 Tax=Nicrophorus vespilloides TaxID=110193 RepID=A0ABM1NDK3_NICVS|nr:PREDICTED: replication protein A 32 kDa subunit [Nicrophorus vespilloides]
MFFDTSGSGQGFFNSNDVDSPSKKKSQEPRRVQNIVPVCVRQIRDCTEEEFELFGMKVQIVRIIGILREVNVTSTQASYTVEDHTGSINGILWLETDNDKLPTVLEGRYVQIYGTLRSINGEKSVMIFNLSQVKNINMITTHLLEMIHVRLVAEKMSKDGKVLQIQNNPGAELANSMSVMFDGSSSTTNKLTRIQQAVYRIIMPDDGSGSKLGVGRQDILSKFPDHERMEVNNAIEYLSSEGHIFSSIDENHFLATDAINN